MRLASFLRCGERSQAVMGRAGTGVLDWLARRGETRRFSRGRWHPGSRVALSMTALECEECEASEESGQDQARAGRERNADGVALSRLLTSDTKTVQSATAQHAPCGSDKPRLAERPHGRARWRDVRLLLQGRTWAGPQGHRARSRRTRTARGALGIPPAHEGTAGLLDCWTAGPLDCSTTALGWCCCSRAAGGRRTVAVAVAVAVAAAMAGHARAKSGFAHAEWGAWRARPSHPRSMPSQAGSIPGSEST
jgi:hypothetical protein